jgi:hypothetical protein
MSKRRGKKKRGKKEKYDVSPDFEQRIRELQNSGELPGNALQPGAYGLPPLSERIIEIAGDLFRDAENHQAGQNALIIAMMAWNASTEGFSLGPDETFKAILQAYKLTELDMIVAMRKAFDTMIERRKKLFPEDRRVVADHCFSMTASGEPHFEVASLIMPPEGIMDSGTEDKPQEGSEDNG